mmetsp:Transcript_28313/g.79205  ORF Transcript_28313/g.79205 Transcript_28313/m.79205 type:complete len:119 (-) Transcript_28313:532-888(-)
MPSAPQRSFPNKAGTPLAAPGEHCGRASRLALELDPEGGRQRDAERLYDTDRELEVQGQIRVRKLAVLAQDVLRLLAQGKLEVLGRRDNVSPFEVEDQALNRFVPHRHLRYQRLRLVA